MDLTPQSITILTCAAFVLIIIPACMLLAVFKPRWLGIPIENGKAKKTHFYAVMAIVWIGLFGLAYLVAPPEQDMSIEAIAQDAGLQEGEYIIHADGSLEIIPPKD